MKSIGKIFGVPVNVHWTFLLLAIFLFANTGLLGLFILTFSILVHEMGHALAAIRYSDMKPRIALMGFGGVMFGKGSELPSPLKEAAISAAGPFSNLFLALLALPFFSFPTGLYFIKINVLLGIINLIPAYPLDGGHILKSLLRIKYGIVKSMRLASSIGVVVCMAAAAFFFVKGATVFALVFLILFPYMSWKEYKSVKDFYA